MDQKRVRELFALLPPGAAYPVIGLKKRAARADGALIVCGVLSALVDEPYNVFTGPSQRRSMLGRSPNSHPKGAF